MTYHIEVQYDVDIPENIKSVLEETIQIVLEKEKIPEAALSLLLTSDMRVQQLNLDFRGLDKTTDVLSFPAGEFPLVEAEEIPYLGDVVISIPTATIQAQNSGHSLSAELQLLAVHGVLHLLGHDHLMPDDKNRMWSIQEQILISLGLGDVQPTES